MSVVKHTIVHSLFYPDFGVVNFEVDMDDPTDRYVNVWFEAESADRRECPTWNGLCLEDKKQYLFLRGVARAVWADLLYHGFNTFDH